MAEHLQQSFNPIANCFRFNLGCDKRRKSYKNFDFALAAIVLYFVSTTFSVCNGQRFDNVFNTCCELGRVWGEQSEHCDSYPRRIEAIEVQDQETCRTTIGICCKAQADRRLCQRGLEAAQAGNACSPFAYYNFPGDQAKHLCCQCCSLGLLAGSSDTANCNEKFVADDSKCNQHYADCCSIAQQRSSTRGGGGAGNTLSDDSTNGGAYGHRSQHYTPDRPPSRRLHTDAEIDMNWRNLSQSNSPSQSLCAEGLEYNQALKECVDVNECQRGLDDCALKRLKCVNYIGSYRCEQRGPSDDSALALSPSPAAALSAPISMSDRLTIDVSNPPVANNMRSEERQCSPGFHYNFQRLVCEDINECALGIDNCQEGEVCHNQVGRFRCSRTTNCGTGYTLDGSSNECVDIDECEQGTHNCGRGYTCRNVRGTFRCEDQKCPPKYVLNRTSGQCEPLYCKSGYEVTDESVCKDINECETRRHNCRINQRCINTDGGFTCASKINCPNGYAMDDSGIDCVDINECRDGTHQCTGGQQCENRNGSYVCKCSDGYEFDYLQRSCKDIDECRRISNICGSLGTCVNIDGSYRCTCKLGYEGSGDGKTCRDVNECASPSGNDRCEHTCINTNGGFQCTCRNGYRLAPDKRHCLDIDECAERGAAALCNGECRNFPGGYNCTCPRGFRMLDDGRTCRDINECDEQQPGLCGDQQVCTNTHGSFRCHTIQCPTGYLYDRVAKNRCRRESLVCQVGDTACLNKPISYSYNFLSLTPDFPIPNARGVEPQLDLFTMRGPQQPSTRTEFALNLLNARAASGVRAAVQGDFVVRDQRGFNQANVGLIRSLAGPQDVELELVMNMSNNGVFSGRAIAYITIHVAGTMF